MIALEAAPAAAPAALARRVAPWLLALGALGAVLASLYPDSYQQDGGHHFLVARWAVVRPWLFLDSWGRPLFTSLYALPAQLGYPVAKLTTVAVCLAAAWNGARLAEALGLRRAALMAPLLFLQPSFLLLCPETMTEPLFALVLAMALRLHLAGRVRAGLWVVGLLPLVRPEGFFVGILWGAFTLLDPRAGGGVVRRGLATLRLLGGTAAWWVASVVLTHDPLWIRKNWPSNWAAGFSYGTGPLWHYLRIHHEILAGPMALLFLVGLVALLRARRAVLAMSSILLVAGLHAVFFHFGLFGSAGYARYLVCVSVPMALACLAGWNAVADGALRLPAGWRGAAAAVARGWNAAVDRIVRLPRALRTAVAVVALLWTAVHALVYVDAFGSSRDAWAVQDMYAWFQAHPQPVRRLVTSQAYMRILFGRDSAERLPFTSDREKNVALLRAAAPGTLVFWDAATGPQFYGIGAADLERAGYRLLRRREYDLRPRLPVAPASVQHRRQELVLYYKP